VGGRARGAGGVAREAGGRHPAGRWAGAASASAAARASAAPGARNHARAAITITLTGAARVYQDSRDEADPGCQHRNDPGVLLHAQPRVVKDVSARDRPRPKHGRDEAPQVEVQPRLVPHPRVQGTLNPCGATLPRDPQQQQPGRRRAQRAAPEPIGKLERPPRRGRGGLGLAEADEDAVDLRALRRVAVRHQPAGCRGVWRR